MPDNVRINVDINTHGTPELQQLAAAMRVIQEQAARQEAQLQSLSHGYQKLGQSITSALDTLGKSGVLSGVTTETAQAVQALKTAGTEITGIVTNLNGQRVKLNVDSSDFTTASTRAKQFRRDLDEATQRARRKSSPELEIAQATAQQLRAGATQDIGIGPDVEDVRAQRIAAAEEAERRVEAIRARSSADVLAVPLRKLDNSGLDAQNQKLREGIALQTGGEEALLKLRIQDLEAVRQIGLAEAKTAETQQRVNQSVDAAIAREKDHSGLVQELKLREEIAATETKFGALVDKTNQRELTSVQKIQAEREKNLKHIAELEARAPDYKGGAKLREQINAKADADLKEESRFNFRGRRGLSGNVLQSALYAAQSPQYAAFSAVSGLAEKLPAVGIAAGVAAVAVGTLVKEFYGLVESEASAARETLNTASRLGITGEQVQKLSASAALVGVNFAAVEGASRQLAAALEEPTGTGKRASEALAKLGIATYQTTGRARELGPVFLDVLKALSQVSDTAERLDLANKLLPRGGAKQIQPWIENLGLLNQAIVELGVGSGKQEQIEKLAAVDLQLQELHQDWAQLKRDFAEVLIPTIKPLVGGLHAAVDLARGGDEFEKRVNAQVDAERSQTAFGIVGPGEYQRIREKLQHEDLAKQVSGYAARNTQGLLNANLPGSSASQAELRKLGADVEGKEVELSQAKETYKTARAKVESDARLAQLAPIERTKAFADVESAAKDVKQKEAELKALRKQDTGRDPFGVELDRIAAEARKFQFPASEYGRITELQNELVKKLKEYNDQVKEGTLTRAKANILAKRETESVNRDIVLEAQRLGEERRQRRVSIANVGIEAELDTQKREFSAAQAFARINSSNPDGDPALIQQAFETQKQIATTELSTRLNQNQEILPQNRQATEQEKHAKALADARLFAKFDADNAEAEINRDLALAENRRKEFDEAKKNAEELAHIRNETELHGFQLQIEHAAHIAELTRDRESPVSALERAFETEKKLAQLAFDFETRENAVTFRDDPEKRKIEDEKARQRLIEDGQRSEYEREEKLAALRKQERDSSKAAAASLYDAIRGGSRGLHDFFKAQADKIGQNAFAALVGPVLGNVSKGIDPTGQGFIHDIIQGTIGGGSLGTPRQRPDEIGPVAAIPPGQEPPHHSGFRNFLAALTTGIPERPTAPLITPSVDIQAGVLAHPELLGAQQSQTISNEALQASIKQLAEPGAAKLAGPTSEISALIPHLDTARGSLDTLRGSVDTLNATISAAPPAPSGTASTASAPAPGSPALTELQAHSLVHSSRNAVTAANKLANTPNEPVTASVDTAALADALKQPKPPLVAPAQPTAQTGATTAATLQALRNTNALRESSVPPQIASGLQYVGIPAAQDSAKAQASQQAASAPPALPVLPSPLAINTPPSIPGLKGRYSPLGVAEYIVPPTLRNQYLPNDSDAITSPAEGATKPRTLYSADLDTSEIRTHERIHQAQDQLTAPKPYQIAKAIAPIFGGDEKKANEYIRRVGLTDVDDKGILNSSEARKQGAAEAPAYLFQAPPAVNSDKQYLEGLEPQAGLEGYQNAYNNYVNLLKALNPGKPVGIEQVAPPEFQKNYLKTQPQPFETLPPRSGTVSPYGFQTLGELASSDVTGLRGLFAGPAPATVAPRESFPVKPPSLGLHITGPLPAPPTPEPNVLQRLASSANPLPALQGTIQEYLNRPAEIRKQFDALGAFQEQDKSGKPFTAAQKARIEAAMNAHLPNAEGNLLAEQLAPLVKASEQIGKGDLAGASGTVIGSAAPFLIGKGLGFAGASLPEATAGLKTLQEHPAFQALRDETGSFGPGSGRQQTIRLYRGEETPGQGTAVPEWVKQDERFNATQQAEGRWYTSDLAEAQKYAQEANHGRVVYQDIPEDVAKQNRANDLPAASKFVHTTKRTQTNDEYFLPEEYKGKGIPLSPAIGRTDPKSALFDTLFNETGSVGPGSGRSNIAPLEPWQIRKQDLIPYKDILPIRRSPIADTSGGYSEAEMHERTIRYRNSESEPPQVKQHPIGSYGIDSTGELMQLRQYSLDDPRLIFPEGSPNPQNQTVQKYADWMRQGSQPPPLTALETEQGNIKISEGHHRAEAIRQTGGKDVNAWVSLTENVPIGERDGQIITSPRGVTHEGVVKNALQAGQPVPPQVLADYPQLAGPAIGRTDPVIAALATNTDATKSLTDAILNVTPGGGVGPNPLAQNPLPAAAIAPVSPGAATGAGIDIAGNIAGNITGASFPELPGPSAPYTPTIVLPPSAADLTGGGTLSADVSTRTPTSTVAPTAASSPATKTGPLAATQSALHELSRFSSAVHGPAGQAFGAAGSVGGILQNIQDLRGALAARKTRQYEQAYYGLPIPGHTGDLTLPNLDLPTQQAGLSPHGFATLPQQFASIGDIANQRGILSGGNSYSDQSYRPATAGLAGQFGPLPGAPAYQDSNAVTNQGPVSVSPEGVPTFTAQGSTSLLDAVIPGVNPLPSAPPFSDATSGVRPELSAIPTGLDQQFNLAYPNINSGSTGVLPQSVLDAADPFNSPGAALRTFTTALGDISKGASGGIPTVGNTAGGYQPGSDSAGNFVSTPISRLGGFGGVGKDKAGSAQQFGDIAATGATVGAGVEGLLSGLHEGGAKGGFQATASVLGTAAALDPEPISKAILGIAAGITAAIGTLFPDPRAQRIKQLTNELFQQKIAAEPFVQPGINVEESATGRAIGTDFMGNPTALNARPLVYTIREAIGFQPLHGDRVVTAPVRQVGIGPLGGFANPLAAQSPLVSTTPPNLPLGSRDTNPLVMSGNGPANTFRSGTQQDSARQDGPQQQAPAFTVTHNNTFNMSAMDSQDIMRRGPDIANALVQQMQTTHRFNQELRNVVTQT